MKDQYIDDVDWLRLFLAYIEGVPQHPRLDAITDRYEQLASVVVRALEVAEERGYDDVMALLMPVVDE